MDRIELTSDYSISRIIKGGWHLAGGHGQIDEGQAIDDMWFFVKNGITTFDCADIYTGVEELIGKFLKKNKGSFDSGELSPVQIHTKYVPDYDSLDKLKKANTEKIIDRSLKRLGVERLDLVQFAWWDYRFENYVDTAIHLSEIQKAGKIKYIGATNFDEKRLKEIMDAGVNIISHQVQYSSLDHRPETKQVKLSKDYEFSFFCYGTVAGGFLSDKYLDVAEPHEPFENRSLTKYKLIIDEYGTWDYFQHLLSELRRIADKYNVDITEVAISYILEKEKVAAVIVGARNKAHLERLKKINSFKLDKDDLSIIKKISDKSNGPLGPVYDLERDKNGKHGSIMKYNLNQA